MFEAGVHIIRILLVVVFGFLTCPVFAKQNLNMAVSISNSSQRAAYYNLIQAFEDAHPNAQITLTSYTSEVFKDKFPQMLLSNRYDILYWHAGERLFEYIEQGKVAPINDMLSPEEMAGMFDKAVIDSISLDNSIYALPLSYYQIGFYYHIPLFAKFGLTEPRTWEEFLAVCEVLKQNNVLPIYIGSKSNWPATAWFDYLNLRLNGIEFHKKLLRGEVSFLDKRIYQVLEKIQYISKAEYFIQEHQNLDWNQGLPLLFRGLAGMSMLGNYAVQNFPEKIKDKIGFFKFPILNDLPNYYEEAPLDVLVVPATSSPKQLTRLFIRFAAQSDNQNKFNKSLGILSPHKEAQQDNSSLVQEAYYTITNAAGITQFFDRDTRKTFADQAMPLFDQFMLNLNIEATQKALEEVRQTIFTAENFDKDQTNIKE